MPNFVLNRDYTYRSPNGVVSFEKGKPTFVPAYLSREIAQIGGEQVDGDEVALLDPESKLAAIPEGQDRLDQLFTAFELLIERNESSDFTAQGVPTVKAVEKIVGFDVERNEVVAAWAEHKASKAD